MSRTRKINDYFRHKLKKDPETSAETNEIGDTIVVQTRCDSVQHAPASSASPGLRSSSSAVLDETKPTMVAVIPDRTGSSQSSQLKIDSSSQRTLSNGQVVIRSSDDEDDDSDGSFNALDELLSLRKPREVVAIDVDGTQDTTPEPRTLRTSTRRAKPRSPERSESRKYKFSLESLVTQTEKDLASEAAIADLQASLQFSCAESRSQDGIPISGSDDTVPNGMDRTTDVDDSLLISVMGEGVDIGGLGRIKHAMERTEVLNRSKIWRFFGSRPATDPEPSNSFPERLGFGDSVETLFDGLFLLTNRDSGPELNALLGRALRDATFLAGFIEELDNVDTLPGELVSWMLDECKRETFVADEDHVTNKVASLEQSSASLFRILDSSRLDGLSHRLGASKQATSLGQAVTPVSGVREDGEDDIPVGQLCSVINLLGGAASGLSEETRQHATCLLFRLCLDGRAMNDIRIGQSVQDSLISLTDCGPSESWDQILRLLRETIAGFTDDSALRLQMLQQIPISTSRLHYLRRCLAVRFFLEDEQQSGGISRFSLGRVMQRLQDSRFNINTAIDYGDLAAMMGILDIALDNGLDPSETLIPENEHDFNQQIDILAQQIKTKFTQIMDTGASHMKRTEAKEVLDRLHYRLVYAVRTKPKVKQDIFQSRLTTKEIEGEDPRPWAKLLSKDRADTAVKNIEELGS